MGDLDYLHGFVKGKIPFCQRLTAMPICTCNQNPPNVLITDKLFMSQPYLMKYQR